MVSVTQCTSTRRSKGLEVKFVARHYLSAELTYQTKVQRDDRTETASDSHELCIDSTDHDTCSMQSVLLDYNGKDMHAIHYRFSLPIL